MVCSALLREGLCVSRLSLDTSRQKQTVQYIPSLTLQGLGSIGVGMPVFSQQYKWSVSALLSLVCQIERSAGLSERKPAILL